MNKRVSGNYFFCFNLMALCFLLFSTPDNLPAQGYLRSEVRSTNCNVGGHEADRWFFGELAGMDFRGQDVNFDPNNHYMNVYTSPAIMSDSNGNVLFYSDGIRIYDKLGGVMPNGGDLHGFGGYAMPVLIVPRPGHDSIYYVFTAYRGRQNALEPIQSIKYGLEYNEVNMKRNGGLGDVTLKHKQLLPPEVCTKLTAVMNSNGKDYWVVTHKFNSNEFYSIAVTQNGVDTNNLRKSPIGSIHTIDSTNNSTGYMKISPDGTRLALAIHGSHIYEIFNFNAGDGFVYGPVIKSPTTFDDAYGIEFSPDSKYLYATTTSTELPQPNYTPPSYLFQFDLSNPSTVFSSYDTIALDTNGSYFGGLQLGTDGRIYVSRAPFGNAALSIIQNPKRDGQDCNFDKNLLDLEGTKSHYGFPNFIQSYFDLPHFNVENVCFENTTSFILQNYSNVDNTTWVFNDPGGNPSDTFHLFSGPGTYQVQVTEFFGGKSFGPYTETVVINELPVTQLADTIYMYPGSPVLLEAGAGYVSYEWSTGENGSHVIKVDEPGIYSVTVQNDRCCYFLDSTLVMFFDVIVPNAFRPGGVNNTFKAYASSLEAINNFTMYIFNRWGQQVYVSEDIDQGWDGRIDGKEAPGDVYVWLINYDVERSGKMVKIAYKGNVILLR